MNLEEAYAYSCPHQFLGRDVWIKQGMIMHLVSREKTLKEIIISLDSNTESLEADDWNIYEIAQ